MIWTLTPIGVWPWEPAGAVGGQLPPTVPKRVGFFRLGGEFGSNGRVSRYSHNLVGQLPC